MHSLCKSEDRMLIDCSLYTISLKKYMYIYLGLEILEAKKKLFFVVMCRENVKFSAHVCFSSSLCPLCTPLGGAHRLSLSGYQIISPTRLRK